MVRLFRIERGPTVVGIVANNRCVVIALPAGESRGNSRGEMPRPHKDLDMRQTHRTIMLAAALVLVAGSAAPVMADQASAPKLTAQSGRAGSTLTMNGMTVRTTAARIANQRAMTFPGSTTMLVTWDELAGGAKTSWYAISRTGESIDQVAQAGTVVQLRYASFDPIAGAPAVPASLKADANNEIFLVQFVATPLDEMRAAVRAAGGTVEAFLPDNTHIVRMNAAARAAVAALPYVRWVGAYEPAYRMSEEVRADVQNLKDQTSYRYSIECFRDGLAQQNAVAAAITAMGGMVEGTNDGISRMEATLTPAQAVAVAKMNEVSFMDPWGGPGGTDMDIARQIGGAVPILSGVNFLGQGVRGEIHDTEVSSTHPQWNGQTPLIHGTNGNSGTHGSSCYGINFATGTGNAQATGLLPQREQGIFFWYTRSSQFTAGQPTRLAMNIEAIDPAGQYRCVFQTSSVGSAQVTTYTTISREVDDYLFKIDYLSCQSQSNTSAQTSRPQAWAKNIVSVGALDHNNTLTRADDTLSGASFGPAQDGRIKPDLLHFYDDIFTTTSGTGYTQFGGTSGATPIVAGHFGLLMQMWHEGVWAGFGGGSSVLASRPFQTTAKAMICASSFRYPLAPLTRARQGWGMPDLGKLYNLRNTTFIVNADDPVQNAQTKTYQINVASGTPELLVTMCYIDPAPATTSNPQRVNDLSLRVTAPGGTIYWGNNGLTASNFSSSGGSANTLDTVENVFLQNPAAGTWTVEVVGTQVVTDAYPTGSVSAVPSGATDAGFSLVVLGGTEISGATCYANCDSSTVAPCLNVQDFACFLNSFASGGSYANCDNSTAAPVLNVQDFGCFLNVFAAGCSGC